MRVTFSASFRDAVAEISRTAEQLAEAQHQVSSGRRINTPSDDPAGTSAAITDRATLGTLDAYTKTADTATSRLTVVDSALSDIINKITAAQTAVASARGSATSQSQRDAAATNLQAISDALLSDFNAQFHGAYLFGGSKATTAPYTAGAGGVVSSYQGNATTMSVDVGPGRSVQVAFDGSIIAQGGAPTDIFATLSSLVTAAKAGDSVGLSQGLDALGRALDRATLAQTQVGTGLSTLDDARARLGTQQLNTTADLSKTEDANMASAITQMSQADTAYRAALGAFSKIGTVSLMDYLK
jgi:flagellar hook-associated protein 3 FlgL